MLKTYQNTSGILNINHMNAALYSVIGSAVNWILFNINIACINNNFKEKNTSNEEVKRSILSILKFQELIPDLLNVSKQTIS